MIEILMDNPYAWLLLSFCTVASLAFGIIAWIAGKKVKEISVDLVTNDMIKCGKANIPKLEITYDEKPIQDLSSTVFYIWNSGNQVIVAQDIVSARPLRIYCSSDNILDVQILKQSDESNAFTVQQVSPTEVILAFEYMNSHEGVKLQVLHTGSSEELISDCKIKGGKDIRMCPESKKIPSFKEEMLLLLYSSLVFLSSIYFTKWVMKLTNIFWSIVTMLVTTVAIFFLCIFIHIKIKKSSRKTVPQSLFR